MKNNDVERRLAIFKNKVLFQNVLFQETQTMQLGGEDTKVEDVHW